MIRDPPATSISIISDERYFVNCALYPNAKRFRVYFYNYKIVENVKVIKFNAAENISVVVAVLNVLNSYHGVSPLSDFQKVDKLEKGLIL